MRFSSVILSFLLLLQFKVNSQTISDPLLWISINNSNYASFSNDGKWVLMQSDSTVFHPNFIPRRPASIRDINTGEQVFEFLDLEKNGKIWQAKFSPDNKFVVTTDDGGYVCLWNIEGNQMINSWRMAPPNTSSEPILDFVFSQDGKKMITFSANSSNHRIVAREFPSGKIAWERGTKGYSSIIQIVNNLNYLFVEDQIVENFDIILDRYMLDVETGKVVNFIGSDTTKVETLSGRLYSNDGKYYLQKVDNRPNQPYPYIVNNIYDAQTDQLIFSIPNPENLITQSLVLGFSPVSNHIFVSTLVKENIGTGTRTISYTDGWNFITGKKIQRQSSGFGTPDIGYKYLSFTKDLKYYLLSTGGTVEVFKSNWNITSITANEGKKSFDLSVISNQSAGLKITFNILKDLQINLSLFDVQGKLVEIIKDGHFPSGDNSFSKDISHLPQGVYFLQLSADGQTQTEKIIIE